LETLHQAGAEKEAFAWAMNAERATARLRLVKTMKILKDKGDRRLMSRFFCAFTALQDGVDGAGAGSDDRVLASSAGPDQGIIAQTSRSKKEKQEGKQMSEWNSEAFQMNIEIELTNSVVTLKRAALAMLE